MWAKVIILLMIGEIFLFLPCQGTKQYNIMLIEVHLTRVAFSEHKLYIVGKGKGERGKCRSVGRDKPESWA